MFCGYTANFIFASTIFSFIISWDKLYHLHSGFILHDISNAYSAISTVTFFNSLIVLILLGTLHIKYSAHFLFFSPSHAPNF